MSAGTRLQPVRLAHGFSKNLAEMQTALTKRRMVFTNWKVAALRKKVPCGLSSLVRILVAPAIACEDGLMWRTVERIYFAAADWFGFWFVQRIPMLENMCLFSRLSVMSCPTDFSISVAIMDK